jgi:hypothetical protein
MEQNIFLFHEVEQNAYVTVPHSVLVSSFVHSTSKFHSYEHSRLVNLFRIHVRNIFYEKSKLKTPIKIRN